MTINESIRRKGFRYYAPLAMVPGLITRKLSPSKNHILLACMPKSSSTFLTNLVSSYADIKRVSLVPDYGGRSQEFCEFKLLMNHHKNYISQQHIKCSDWTQEMLRRYNITPIVLVRNLADCVISIREHILKERDFGAFLAVDERVMTLDNENLERLIIQIVMPWYLEFYCGWQKFGAATITYDQVLKSPEETLRMVLTEARIEILEPVLAKAVRDVMDKFNRFNVGVSGRGATLSDANQRRLADLIKLYPSISSNTYLSAN